MQGFSLKAGSNASLETQKSKFMTKITKLGPDRVYKCLLVTWNL